MEAFSSFCKRYRVEPETKRNNYCILQAEDELSAAGITIATKKSSAGVAESQAAGS